MDYNFKQDNMKHWMKLLYGAFPKYYLDTLKEIIEENTILHENVPCPTDIMYVKGTAFTSAPAPIGSNPARYEVHPELVHRVLQLFTEKTEIADEEVIVQGYLRRLLNITQVREDVSVLLADNIKDYLLLPENHKNELAITVTKEKREEFIKRNKQFSDLITQRMLTNILLAG